MNKNKKKYISPFINLTDSKERKIKTVKRSAAYLSGLK